MSRCPSSPEQGCKCWEHCQGPLAPAQPTTLRIVTPGPPTPRDAGDLLLTQARSTCIACQGNPAKCREGLGAPSYRRLPGCAAWAEDGTLEALKAPERPRQPWDVRPARKVA